MKKILLLALTTASLASAQETLDETVVIDLEARRQSVVTIREHVKMREQRLDDLVEDLRERGESVDAQIKQIVDSLSKLKDSQSSQTRISMLKSQAAQGLMEMIETYQTERRKIVERAKKDQQAPRDALTKDIEIIDKKVDERAAQIVQLVKSIPGGADVKKYETTDRHYWGGGYGWSNSRVTDSWKQNRRDKVQSNKQRREVQQALTKSIEDLERSQDQITAFLERRKMTDAEREIQELELDHVKRTLATRRSQLAEVTMPSNSAHQNTSRNEADDLKALFQEAGQGVSNDFWRTIQLYHQASEKRDQLHDLKTNLEAREKWLKENDPDWEG